MRLTVAAFAQMGKIELQADLEHQQHQADLRQHLHRLGCAGVEYILKQLGREQAEQRRPEQNADHDFTDHRGLSDAQRNPAADARGEHDHGELQQGEKQQCFGFMGGDVNGCCHGIPMQLSWRDRP